MPSAPEIAQALRAGRPVSDRAFDALYGERVRRLSGGYWTPVGVALRAARLLAPDASARVLDIGCGAGKLCLVGAAATGGWFTGIEHRASLVDAAHAARAALGDVRADFLVGTIADIPWRDFDAFYLFNPFAENVYRAHVRIDETVELSRTRMLRDVEAVREGLASARAGTRVVTYFGMGGPLPASYRCAAVERHLPGSLRLWINAP